MTKQNNLTHAISAEPMLKMATSLSGKIALTLLLLFGCINNGCSGELSPLNVSLDVSNCFDHQRHSRDGLCALALSQERFGNKDLIGCLAWKAAGSEGVIKYKYAKANGGENYLQTVEGGPVSIPIGIALRLKFFLIKPDAQTNQCSEFKTYSNCNDDDHPNCLLAFREQVIIDRPSTGRLDLVFGSDDIPCGIECNDSCDGEECPNRLCWRPEDPYHEICDDRDNNCSGEARDIPGLGESCNTGLNEPCVEGILECDPSSGGTDPVCRRINLDYDLVDGECIIEMQTICAEPEDLPSNGEIVEEDVSIHYTRQDGWSNPSQCRWRCVDGFVQEEGGCINSKEVPCNTDGIPDNSEFEIENVWVETRQEGDQWVWGEPELCSWRCDNGFVEEEDQCLDSKEVQCSTQTSYPPNSNPDVVMVTVTAVQEGDQWVWSEPDVCDWECVEEYKPVQDGCYPLPTVETLIAELMRPNGAIVGGQVTDSGGLPVVEWGFVYGTISFPQNPGNTAPEGTDYSIIPDPGELEGGLFEYTTDTIVSVNTDVFYRAYIQTEAGFGYGEERRFNIRTVGVNNEQLGGDDSINDSLTLSNYTVPSDQGDNLVLCVHVMAMHGVDSEASTCHFNGREMLKVPDASGLYLLGSFHSGGAAFYLDVSPGEIGDILVKFPNSAVHRGTLFAVTLSNVDTQVPAVGNFVGQDTDAISSSLSGLDSQFIVISSNLFRYEEEPHPTGADHQLLLTRSTTHYGAAFGYKDITGPSSGPIGWAISQTYRAILSLTAFAPWDDVE